VTTFIEKVNYVSSQTGVTVSGDLANGFTFTSINTGSSARIDISGLTNVLDVGLNNKLMVSKNGGNLTDSTGIESVTGLDASLTIDNTSTTGTAPTTYVSSGNIITFVGGDYDGLQIRVDASADGSVDDININITANNVLSVHIGANQDQTMSIGINDMRARALGVDVIDVTSKTGAETAISTITTAIDLVSAERAKLGAYQNRLEHTINNLGTAAENLQAAESRIRDVDMAKEMMEFTKLNILQQAATAMLAQANQMPQAVLQLLR
jgi:flagellin